jgi:hypothetical protein
MPKVDLSIKIKKYFVDKVRINSTKCYFIIFYKEKDYIFLIFLLIFKRKDVFEKQCFTKMDLLKDIILVKIYEIKKKS